VAGRIVVGTSSWSDRGFIEDWYPEGMPARERLPWYAKRFEAVEVNSSFYAVPSRSTVARWVEATPEGFTFDVKAHRLLSRHSGGLDSLPPDMRDDAETNDRGRVKLTGELERELLDRLLAAVEPLEQAGRLSSILVQLTPAFAPGRHELAELKGLIGQAEPRRVAIELRHRGWLEGDRVESTLGFLSEAGVAFVAVDAPREEHVPIMPPIDAVTRDDLAYLRAHGRNATGYMTGRTVAERFGWRYSDEELSEIGTRTRGMADEADEVRVMFNNNRSDDAPTAAQRFRSLMGQDPGPPAEEPQQRLV
jgi:uncharacterized protein YecE (DUF72 family)